MLKAGKIKKGLLKPDKILPGDSQKRVLGAENFDELKPGLNPDMKIVGKRNL
jgi:hypothetical protein